MLVDTHTHVVSHDEDRYPLSPTALPGDAWYRTARVDVDELLALCAGAGVDRVVLVQPSGAYSVDNIYLSDATARHPGRVVGVATVEADPARVAGDQAAIRLRHWVRDRGLHGVRVFALAFDGSPGWLADPRTFPLWEEAGALGIHVVVTCFTHQLGALRTVLRAFPDVPVSLDHCGFPDLDDGPPWRGLDPLLALSDLGGLRLKVSSHLLEAAAAAGDPADLVAALDTHFGAERLMWGSDYPQTHDRSYADLLALGRAAARRLDPAGREQFLGGTALAAWPALADPPAAGPA